MLISTPFETSKERLPVLTGYHRALGFSSPLVQFKQLKLASSELCLFLVELHLSDFYCSDLRKRGVHPFSPLRRSAVLSEHGGIFVEFDFESADDVNVVGLHHTETAVFHSVDGIAHAAGEGSQLFPDL